MKLKVDENLPEGLVEVLSTLGHDAHSVRQEGMAGRPDSEIWNAAVAKKRILITQDLDFSDFRAITAGSHAGILLIRLREPGREALLNRVRTLFENEAVDRWGGCVVVATDRKIRIRRAAPLP